MTLILEKRRCPYKDLLVVSDFKLGKLSKLEYKKTNRNAKQNKKTEKLRYVE